MLRSTHLRLLINYFKQTNIRNDSHSPNFLAAHIHTTVKRSSESKEKQGQTKELSVRINFENVKEKTKNSYLDMLRIYIHRDIHRRGHVEFIYSALKNMEEFGVHKDLDVYKAIVDVLPKGKFIPQNIIQAEFMHYPKQQQCVIDLLEQMEDNGVMPDKEMEAILLNIFGRRGFPLRKFWRMMYWMPKFKNLSPWPVPNPPPNDSFELAQAAISRISSVDIQAKLTIYQSADLEDSLEDTWIVSSQSPTQKKLLAAQEKTSPVFVEGPFRVWLRNMSVDYFMLRGIAKPFPEEDEDLDDVSTIKVKLFNFAPPQKKSIANIPSVHEQTDGIIYSVCATGTSGKDSLLSWIRHLEKDGNPILANVPVVFKLKSAPKEITVQTENSENNEKLEDR